VPIYGLSEWEGGLIYIPFGIGGVLSTFVSGRMLNRAWQRHRIARGLSTDKAIGDELDTFAVEKARLSTIWLPMIITILAVIGFGWSLHFRTVRPIYTLRTACKV
jgi:predicted MFS family arabinose efflux permease